jgi:hypothetical protein
MCRVSGKGWRINPPQAAIELWVSELDLRKGGSGFGGVRLLSAAALQVFHRSEPLG